MNTLVCKLECTIQVSPLLKVDWYIYTKIMLAIMISLRREGKNGIIHYIFYRDKTIIIDYICFYKHDFNLLTVLYYVLNIMDK